MKGKSLLATLTAEDAQKLEDSICVRKGGPVSPLPIEHYFELGRVEDEVVRSWYEYKAAGEACSLRELRKAIREDLFGTILGRPTPQRKPRKVSPVQKKEEKFEPRSPEEKDRYNKLVHNIVELVKETEAKGIPMRHVRHDILECTLCGAYEDVLCEDAKRKTYLRSGEVTSKEFQVVRCKDRSQDLEDGGVRCTIRYQFICGVCGAFQTQTIRESFED